MPAGESYAVAYSQTRRLFGNLRCCLGLHGCTLHLGQDCLDLLSQHACTAATH